jgi:hypothetical protein
MTARTGLTRRKKLLFAFVPLLLLLLGGELTARLIRAPTHFGSFRALRVDLMQRGYPAVPDPTLGYAPKPGFTGGDNHWGTTVSIDDAGVRRNGPGAPPAGPAIVAVGDSFTFGDQVSDHETWPAHLEAILGQPVRNGGVFGYSLAQAILRAELLIAREPTAWLVVSVFPDDIVRCEYKKRYTGLPWFDVEGGALVLRNVPVQDMSDPDELRQRAFKDALGRSALVDAVLATVAKQWWIENQKQVRVHPEGKGAELAPLLIDRIAAFCRGRGVRLLVLLQGDRSTTAADALLAHAKGRGLATLDLIAEFVAAAAADPTVKTRWFAGHMTSAGNRWVAERVAAVIRGG